MFSSIITNSPTRSCAILYLKSYIHFFKHFITKGIRLYPYKINNNNIIKINFIIYFHESRLMDLFLIINSCFVYKGFLNLFPVNLLGKPRPLRVANTLNNKSF